MTRSDPAPKTPGRFLGPAIAFAGGVLTFFVSAFVRLYREITVPLTLILLIWGVAWGIYRAVTPAER
jgi:hypothetical protein